MTNRNKLSIQQIYESFFTPPVYTPTPSEQALLERVPGKRLRVKSGEVMLSSWGESSSTVLLVHGWGGARAQMTGLVEPLLAAGYRVVAFDLPGHGELHHGTTTNLFEMAAAMAAIAPMIGHSHAIIAHSFGSLVTSYTLTREDFPQPSKLVYLGAFNRLMDTFPRFQTLTKLPDQVIDALRNIAYEKYGQATMDTMVNERLLSLLPIPVLMFHDLKDTVTPVTDSRAIASSNPQAQLIETSDLGHTGSLRSGAVHRQIIDFLKKGSYGSSQSISSITGT